MASVRLWEGGGKMRGRIGAAVLEAVLLTSFVTVLSAQERWVYRYNGRPNGLDEAAAVVAAEDGNVYVAGTSEGGRTGRDFIIIRLSPSGEEEWVFRYNGSGDGYDAARSMVVGKDGGLYAAGCSERKETGLDFTVISVSSSGRQQWVYRYNGPGDGEDIAQHIAEAADGSLHIAGWSTGSGTREDFIVIGLSAAGDQSWVYRHSEGWRRDYAVSLAIGTTGNIYTAGWSCGFLSEIFTVIALAPSGAERWIYKLPIVIEGLARAHSITVGPGGDLYAVGFLRPGLMAISLTPSGGDRWEYYPPGSEADAGHSIITGTDYNLYAAGRIQGDFAIAGLTRTGRERWAYGYDGPGRGGGEAYAVAMGPDSNIYAAGYSDGSSTSRDFTVVSLTSSGRERWIYRYDGPGNSWDEARSIAVGPDGNIYVAGWSSGRDTSRDLTVVSLSPHGPGSRVAPPDPVMKQVLMSPIPVVGDLSISFLLIQEGWVNLSVYDSGGRLIRNLLNGWEKPNPKVVQWNLEDSEGRRVRSGAYFVRLEALNSRVCKKVLVLR